MRKPCGHDGKAFRSCIDMYYSSWVARCCLFDKSPLYHKNKYLEPIVIAIVSILKIGYPSAI